MPAESFCPKLASHVRLQLDRLSGAPLLLHPEGAVELSETAEAIVRLCDGERTTGEIVALLADEYNAPEGALRDDVHACLSDLAARGLLV